MIAVGDEEDAFRPGLGHPRPVRYPLPASPAQAPPDTLYKIEVRREFGGTGGANAVNSSELLLFRLMVTSTLSPKTTLEVMAPLEKHGLPVNVAAPDSVYTPWLFGPDSATVRLAP